MPIATADSGPFSGRIGELMFRKILALISLGTCIMASTVRFKRVSPAQPVSGKIPEKSRKDSGKIPGRGMREGLQS